MIKFDKAQVSNYKVHYHAWKKTEENSWLFINELLLSAWCIIIVQVSLHLTSLWMWFPLEARRNFGWTEIDRSPMTSFEVVKTRGQGQVVLLYCLIIHWKISQRSIYGLYNKKAPFLGDLENVPDTINNSRFIISWNYSFHRMTINFPVLSPVCCIFQPKLLHFV